MTDPSVLAHDAEDRRAALDAGVRIWIASSAGWQPGTTDRPNVLDLARDAYRWLRQRDTIRTVHLELIAGQPRKEGTVMSAEFSLPDDKAVTITLGGKDAKGAATAGIPEDTWAWETDDPNGAVAVVTPSADTLSADLAGVAPGVVNVMATGQTSGLVGVIAVTVEAGDPVEVDLIPGEPQPQAAPAPADPAAAPADAAPVDVPPADPNAVPADVPPADQPVA